MSARTASQHRVIGALAGAGLALCLSAIVYAAAFDETRWGLIVAGFACIGAMETLQRCGWGRA